MRQPPIQDVYLAEVKRQGVPVVVYLVNGFQLRGVVRLPAAGCEAAAREGLGWA